MISSLFRVLLVLAANALSSFEFVQGAHSVVELAAAIEHGAEFATLCNTTKLIQRGPERKLELAQSAATPTIATLSPTSGSIGTWVTIRGSNFTSDNLIQFRGIQVSFAAGSPVGSENGTSLHFQVTTCPSYEPQCPGFFVPPGDYKVTIINSNGTSNEAVFTLTFR